MTPRAPFAADVDDHALAFGVCGRDGVRDIRNRVTRGIEWAWEIGSAGGGGEGEEDERRDEDPGPRIQGPEKRVMRSPVPNAFARRSHRRPESW